MALKLGAYTACLHDRPLGAALDVLRSNGLTSVEVNTGGFIPSPHCHVDLLLASEQARADYLGEFSSRGMELTGLNCNGNPLNPLPGVGPKHADDMRRSIELAGALGVRNIVCMSGTPGSDPDARYPSWVVNPWDGVYMDVLAYQWDVAATFWTEIDTLARANNTRMAIEMHPHNVVFSPVTLKKLVDLIGATNVGAEMDPSHLMWQGMDVVAAIRWLGPLVFHAAAKDAAITPGVDIRGVLDTRRGLVVPGTPGDDVQAQVLRWAEAGESYDVEFKGEERERLNDRDLVEAVVCLTNGRGGVLLVGIEDDGSITGARPRHESGRTDPLRLQALVANSTQPPVSVTVEAADMDGRHVLVLRVPDSPRVVGTTRGTYVRRAIAGDGRPTCVPYHAHEMLAHEVDRGAVDWATLHVGGATWDDLDPLEFERLRRLVTAAGEGGDRILAGLSDREIASALGLVRHEHEVTAGALLLFGRVEALRGFLPTHEAAFQVLRGLG